MLKNHSSKLLVILPSLLISAPTFAHTINQHMEQMYGTAYLPFFICARLLPFIGLGLLAHDSRKSSTFQIYWIFFAALILGIVLGFSWHGGYFISMINNVGIIAIGILLLFINSSSNKFAFVLIAVLGISIGYENGLYITHSGHFKWMYISIIGSGACLFLILNNIHFIGNPNRKIPLNFAGIIFIVSGVFLVLLS